MATKKYNFEAETWKILELLTHSIYSNKEIFIKRLYLNYNHQIFDSQQYFECYLLLKR